MVKWKVFCVKILKNTRFIVNHCHPKTTISCNCHAFLTTRHKNFPAMLRDAREKPPWNKNFLPVCQRWKMFLFALDRIERAVGGKFCLYCGGFFSSGPGEPHYWQIPGISTLAGAAVAGAEDGGGTAAKAAIPDTGAKNSGWTRGDILLPLEKLARGLLVIKAFHR